MFSSVTWSQYATVLLVATALYYLLIWIIVFKARLPVLGSALGYRPAPAQTQAEDSPDEMITTAQHVIEELRPLFIPGANKNELLFALRQQLVKYSEWDEPGFRDTLNQYISRQCGTTCSIRLSEDDIRALWK